MRRSRPATTLPLRNIPVGSTVHCIEMKPGKGAQMARARRRLACSWSRAKACYATLRLRSGEMRKVPAECRATIGEVGNVRAQPREAGQGRRQALARRPPDRSRCRHEPGRPSARWWRRPSAGQGNPHPVIAVGRADQGLQDPQEQAHARSSSCAIARS